MPDPMSAEGRARLAGGEEYEAQREYPITWADVAKNSGVEGFLSAFVILLPLI